MNQTSTEAADLARVDQLVEARRARAAANRADRVRATAEPAQRAADSEKPERERLDRILDGYLIAWHHWRGGYQLSKGYRSADSTCQDYQTPGHWDRKHGLFETHIENEILRGVDRAMGRVANAPHRWRTALEYEAHNLATGARVWWSKGLPTDLAEITVLRLEARNRLMRELQIEGVMT